MPYGGEFERRRPWRGARGRWGRWPRKPARGFPVRGFHTYDLDYGRQAGGPDTEYSGRAGWPTGVAEEAPPSRARGTGEFGAPYSHEYGYEYGYDYVYGPRRRRHEGTWVEGRSRGPREPLSFERGGRWRGSRRRRWP